MKVQLVNSTPNAIIQTYKAFRICYAKGTYEEIKVPILETEYMGVPIVNPTPDYAKMIEFIKDKLEKGHESPLEHISFTFSISGVSRALQQQLTRHRTFKFSIQSQRYVDAENFNFVIPESIRNNLAAKIEFREIMDKTFDRYKDFIEKWEIKKEDARMVLPNATTGNILVTCDLRNFRHFYAERQCVHAQAEIRSLANEMMNQVKNLVPFADYKAKKCGITCFECIKGDK